jgi:hypothetical protein
LVFVSVTVAQDPFRDKIQPFLKTYCYDCHGGKKTEAELNLTRYSSAAQLADDFRQWEHVVTFVGGQEMPPDEAKQPTAEERKEWLRTVEALFSAEAKKVAGDPGPVLPRRLSNAEYNYTIRDLTGVDIRPADAFPVDPAAGEGFSNTGEALLMSPGLFKKYYASAEHVADHVDFTPTGWSFAPYPAATYADQKKLHEQRLLDFYEQHDVNYEKYLTAAWRFQHRSENKRTTLENWATQHKLSGKYFSSMYDVLTGKPEDAKYTLRWLRERWQAIPAPAQPGDEPNREVQQQIKALAKDIKQLSKELCPSETQAIVSNAGNGPIQHIDRRNKTAAERDTFNEALLKREPAESKVAGFVYPNVSEDTNAADAFKAECMTFCRLFPNRFVYVDDIRGLSAGFHLIEGFFRDDQPLCKHVLTDSENKELDRLWNELDFGTQIAERMLRGFVFFERSERNFMKHKDFDSFKEEDPELTTLASVQRLEEAYLVRSNVKGTPEEIAKHPIHTFFADIREGLNRREVQLQAVRPGYLTQIEKFAAAAFRRPLAEAELKQLRAFYNKLCDNPETGIEQAVRASLIRTLVSPHFCYRAETPPEGKTVAPVSDLALASRLSYFLWSSLPDEELIAVAKAGTLHEDEVLLAQAKRMRQSPKVSGLALEFFGRWLQYRDFLEQEGVSREAFPQFDDALKQAMFEEPTKLATLLIQLNWPVNSLLDSDQTLVNKRLAKHYGIPFTGKDDQWVEATGLHEQGRAGLLGMAVFLTKNSQPQRTSPVKRGFWVVHHLLGEHIPPPPPDVVALPAKETDTGGKTIRELLRLHTDDAKCARCHVRFDDVGLAMEGFDAIGRKRDKDLAGRAIDNVVKLPSGKEARGIPEFAEYLAQERADEFTKTLNRKLLGYALGRSLQLSDQLLLESMQEKLKQNGGRFGTLIETIVTSPQFRQQRCRDFDPATFRLTKTPQEPAPPGAKP